jgi:hypothetical protein
MSTRLAIALATICTIFHAQADIITAQRVPGNEQLDSGNGYCKGILKCPASDKCTYQTGPTTGWVYHIMCGLSGYGRDYTTYEVDSLEQCIQQCDTLRNRDFCSGVVYETESANCTIIEYGLKRDGVPIDEKPRHNQSSHDELGSGAVQPSGTVAGFAGDILSEIAVLTSFPATTLTSVVSGVVSTHQDFSWSSTRKPSESSESFETDAPTPSYSPSTFQLCPANFTCPSNNGCFTTGKNTKDIFMIQCNTDYQSNNVGTYWYPTLQECITACDDTDACNAVTYRRNDMGGDTACYLHSWVSKNPSYSRDVDSAFVVAVGSIPSITGVSSATVVAT